MTVRCRSPERRDESGQGKPGQQQELPGTAAERAAQGVAGAARFQGLQGWQQRAQRCLPQSERPAEEGLIDVAQRHCPAWFAGRGISLFEL